ENGTYSFTPSGNWNGQVPVITYTTNTGATATLTIEITPVDDPSVTLNDSNTIAEGQIAEGNVLDNDSDPDSALEVTSFEVANDTSTIRQASDLGIRIFNAGQTAELESGQLIINSDGSYTFTPNDNWYGQVPLITYTTNTGGTATLTIEITPVDDPTITVNDLNTVTEDQIAKGNVLDNDSDPDSDLEVSSFEVNNEIFKAGQTAILDNGQLIINTDGSYTFTPDENWNGQVPVITYTTNTGSEATLTIDVTPINDFPEFDSKNYSFNYLENSSDTTVIGTVSATDPEGKDVSYSIVSGDTNGWFEIDPVTGVISLTPAGVTAAANDFEVMANVHDLVVGASDGVNTSNINVTLTELDVNEGPEFTPPVGETSYSFNYLENSSDTTVIGTVSATDPEGKDVSYSIVSGNGDGWFEIDPVTGVISLTPDGVTALANDFELMDNVHDLVVGASDGVNTSNINVTLTELDVNEGPEFTPPVGETSYSFNYLENSSDTTVIGTVSATDPEG
ncbi:Ig-like domain-containing protein, partial [Shewanella sp. A22]